MMEEVRGWIRKQLLLVELLDDLKRACGIIVATMAYSARRDTGHLRMVGRDAVEDCPRC